MNVTLTFLCRGSNVGDCTAVIVFWEYSPPTRYLIAGHQTTSDATTWCLNALSCNQRVQNKLRAEVVKVPTDSPSMDELAALPYLDMVGRETLRLHPPIISTVRTAIKDDNIPLEKPFKGTDGKLHHSVK